MLRLFIFSVALAVATAQHGTIVFDGVEAFIEFPNFPNNYADNLDIAAVIVGPIGSRISEGMHIGTQWTCESTTPTQNWYGTTPETP
ncbi:hypothetical protein BV898_18376 [Hypsibius exemplaris]|uniref:Uncharacterized protein n=1 Tax=Hypsibius exemplaris TaxID=2072580 RepID=A0A9X6NH38_HYPEX|nr:hypothetical protein BV898_18376 [Hypsibius exemplaris]